jgi:uncharacterized protein (TIGR00303 family)
MATAIPKDIIFSHEEKKGKRFVRKLLGKAPTFVCTIGNTETGKIPGISAAGANPQITDFTPAADIELLYFGWCKCINGVPVTPNGIPTPGLITMSAIKLASMPVFAVNGGVNVRPNSPYFELGGTPGKDIRTGKALDDPRKVFDHAVEVGKALARISDYLVVGESIAGGTTTALGVLAAMGYDAEGKVSSSLPENPHSLKAQVVREGLKNAPLTVEQMRKDPMAALATMGDPMIPAAAGVIVGAARSVPVIMAGGTQMAAVLAVVKGMDESVLGNVGIGTTRWIVQDKDSSIVGLVQQIAPVPVIAANLDFSHSRHEGLRIYETGLVKEGVGAGGSSIAAMLTTRGRVDAAALLKEIEENYERLMARKA